MSSLQKKNGIDTVKILSIICPLIYFASYLTRKNYGIVMEAVIASEGIAKADAGLVETLALISYGVGQVISGVLGDKFRPQRVIMVGLASTTVCNLLMPFCHELVLREIIWFINGFAQSMLWPPLVRIMSATMDSKTYSKVCANVNVAGIFGTILLYLSSSLVWMKISEDGWRYTFYSSAFLCLIILVIWIFSFRKISGDSRIAFEKKEKAEKEKAKFPVRLILGSGIVFIAIAIILQGMLRDGITDWVPTFIRETFSIGSDKSILMAVALPVLGVISLKLVGWVNEKFVKEEVRGAAVTFIMSLVCVGLLFFFYDKNQYFTLALSAVSVGCMHAINFFLICIVPVKFEKYGMVSTMSGIINSLTYVGSAAALYGFGFISDHTDNWRACIGAWCVIAAAGIVFCFIAIPQWKKFKAADMSADAE